MAVLLALAGLAAAGCGGDEEGAPIPQATATALNAELDGVQDRLDEGSAGACRDILGGPRDPNMDRVQQLIDSLPDDVDADVRSALEESFDRLWDLVQQDCNDKAQKEEDSQQEPEPEQPTETQTETETQTTPTETETEPTTPTAPEEAPLPNDGDGDSGGGVPGVGNGNGNGNGGGVGPGDGE
jgi:hypothetical protein